LLYALSLPSSPFYNKFSTPGKYFFPQNGEDSDFFQILRRNRQKQPDYTPNKRAWPIIIAAKADIILFACDNMPVSNRRSRLFICYFML